MSEEEINYWLEVFSEDRQAFQSKDGKVISFYKLLEEMKELQSVLKEIREYIEKEVRFVNMQEYHKLLEIIDKGIGED